MGNIHDIGIEPKELIMALNVVPANIIITDVEGIIIWCNDTACSFTGYTRGEMIGENPSILKVEETTLETYVEMWDIIKNKKEIWNGTLKNKKKNGEIYKEELQIIPIINKNNEVTKFIGVQKDVTELEMLRKRENVKDALSKVMQKIKEIQSH